MAYTVSHSILEVLAQYWVKYMFWIPWDAVDSIIDSVRQQDVIEFIPVKHEESGALACSAYGKLTWELSVCMWTSWPWAIHLLNGLYDAKVDRSPVLAITWQASTALLGSDYFQEIDHIKLFDDVAVFNQMLISEEQMPRLLADACKAALVHQWVAHINIPIDISMKKIHRHLSKAWWTSWQTMAVDKDIQSAASLINSAEKPLIFIWRWARYSRKEIIWLAEKIKAPILHSLPAKWICSGHAHSCWWCWLLGTPAWDIAMQWCDLLIMVWTSFPYSSFYPQNNIPALQIDLLPQQIWKRYPVDVWLVWHASPILSSLLSHVSWKENTSFLERVQTSWENWKADEVAVEVSQKTPLKPQTLTKAVWNFAKDDAIFVVDTWAVTVWWARNLYLKPEQEFTVSANLWTMAYSLSWAIWVSFAYPWRQIIALSWDGSMWMLMGDFITAVKHQLPIVVIVYNNWKLWLIQMEQEVHGMPEYMTQLANPDFADFARCCWWHGFTIDQPDMMEVVLEEALNLWKPCIVDVTVSWEELTVPPHITLKQAMWFAEAKMKEFFGKGDKSWWPWVLFDML